MRSEKKFVLVPFLIILNLVHFGLSAEVNYAILEESPPGSTVGSIPDSIKLANLVSMANLQSMRYSFLSVDSQASSLFTLDSVSGILKLSDKVLDREVICPFEVDCNLELQIAIQSTQNQFFRKVTININIIDVNDNEPQFPANKTTLTLSESVQVPSSFPLPAALDRDMGVNNSLKEYELFPKDVPFELVYSIPSSTLLLKVIRELDREVTSNYSLRIFARDGGSPLKEGVLNVDIFVEDVNDNAPIFTNNGYYKVVDETIPPGSVLLTLTATDADSGKNGLVRYSLSRRQPSSVLSMFSVGEISGELRVTGDFQTAETEVYKIDVEATDQGEPPFTTTTTVTIKVQDTINSPPRLVISYLSSNDYSSVSEYANLGVVVAHILVKDTDRGPNGIVQCKLTNVGGFFELQSYDVKEYKIIVAKPLDRETISVHNVTVECYDAGTPSLSTSQTFQVKVTDENDNAPIFTEKELQVRFKENNSVGLQIAQVTATDKDDPKTGNGKVTYRIADEGDADFVIDPNSGVIKAMTLFDFEKRQAVNFTVIAEDNGIPKRSAQLAVMVNIVDVNDNAPHFAQSRFTISISEYAFPGTAIGEITASDLDFGINGQFDISLVPGSGRSRRGGSNNLNVNPASYEGVNDSDLPFLIRLNGTLVLIAPVDYETITTYEFEVLAKDKGVPPLSDTATVVIDVRDENDNAPQILHPNVSEIVFTALTGSETPEVLMTFEVVDKDSGENGRIVFTVTARNDSGRFDVDQRAGDVTRTRQLSANDAGTYKLTVMIKDCGNPPLYDVRTLLIHVLGGNSTAVGRGAGSDQYIVITLTLVCITVLISVTILLVIVIMRRLDRRRKNSRHMEASGAMQFHNSRVVTAFVDPIKMDNFHNESDDNDFREKEDGGKVDKKSFNDSSFGFSTSSGSINKSSDVISSQTIQENNLNIPSSTLNDVDLLQTFQDSRSFVIVQEDGASDSSGDTITSDSGRGGSDDDISASNNLSGHSLDIGTHGSFQSNLSTFCNSGSLKSSVKDPVRSSSRKHVTFKDMDRLRNTMKGQPDIMEINVAPNDPEGGSMHAAPYNGGINETGTIREMNIPVSRDKANIARITPSGYNGFPGIPISKNDLRSLTSPVFSESLNRESPRLVTFSPASNLQQQPYQNLCNPRLPVYCSEDSMPPPVSMDSQRDWRAQFPMTGGPDYNRNNTPYHQFNSPAEKMFQQNRTQSPYTIQPSLCDPRSVQAKESNWTEYLNNINSPKDNKMFHNQRAPSNASLNPDPRLHSPAPHIPPRRNDALQTHRDVHASQASLAGKDVSRYQTCDLPKTATGMQATLSRDWTNDSIGTTEDGDDQRSTTTTSGSYTIDNDEEYLSIDYKPKDIVV